MTTHVAISASPDRDYAFNLPIVGLLWRELVGFNPVFLLTDDRDEWKRQPKRASISLSALEVHGFPLHFVGHVEGYEPGRIGQNAREHASCLDIPTNDWIMMSDADLWPLMPEFYRQHENSSKLAWCYYSNGDHFQGKADVIAKADAGCRFQTIPTCHVTMRCWTWRALYDLHLGQDVKIAVKKTLDTWFEKQHVTDRGFALWMSDQDIVTERLCRQEWFPREAELVERQGHPPADRLDRGCWPRVTYVDGMVDAHVFKAPDTGENWDRLREVVIAKLPQHAEWIEQYRTEFRDSYAD